MSSRKTLVIVRHAKSAWPAGVPDIDRPLSARGRRDAPAVGRWLGERGLPARHAWISPSRRTQQTWALVAAALPELPSHDVDGRIYAAHWSTLLTVVRSFPEDREDAVLVGHNPGCEELAAALAGPMSDGESMHRMLIKYPTAGVAVLTFDRPWRELTQAAAVLTEFAIPRG